MRLLLDMHTFIWYVSDTQKLSSLAQTLIDNEENEILLNAASVWEMAIKQSIGKLSLNLPFAEFIEQQLALNNFKILNIKINYLSVVALLPLHHRDPFDRLLIAQAIIEQVPIIGSDIAFDAYTVQRLWT